MNGWIKALKIINEEQIKNARLFGVQQQTNNIEEQIGAYERLWKSFKDGKISIQQFAGEKEKLDKGFAVKDINVQIETLQKLLEIEDAAGRSTIELDNQIANLEKQLRDKDLEETELNEQKKYDLRKQYQEKTLELAKETADLVTTLISAQYTNELNALQEIKDASDDYYSKEQQNIANSTASAEEKSSRSILGQLHPSMRFLPSLHDHPFGISAPG